MSCPEGRDPFGDRDAALVAHAEGCARCSEVLRVLGACGETWRRGLADDGARGFFRERRLGRARPPARKAMTTLAFAVVLAALSGYAFARRAGPRVEAPEETPAPPTRFVPSDPPRPVARAPRLAPAPEPEATVPPTPRPMRAEAQVEGSRELWQRANALLDAGDRVRAEQAFQRVMELPVAEPGLRSRATFRWAELLLSRGDTWTPREPLFRLVRAKDAALGFDAALLLERCAPGDRARIWDGYLDVTTDPALRARAIEHRR